MVHRLLDGIWVSVLLFGVACNADDDSTEATGGVGTGGTFTQTGGSATGGVSSASGGASSSSGGKAEGGSAASGEAGEPSAGGEANGGEAAFAGAGGTDGGGSGTAGANAQGGLSPGGAGGAPAAGGPDGFECDGETCVAGEVCVNCDFFGGAFPLICAPDPERDPDGYEARVAEAGCLAVNPFFECDGPEDCSENERCATTGGEYIAGECIAGTLPCAEPYDCVICRQDADCPSGSVCSMEQVVSAIGMRRYCGE